MQKCFEARLIQCDKSLEDVFVNGVFIRLFRFLSPEKFDRFSSLPQLLVYVRTCCVTEVLQELRYSQRYNKDILLEFIEADERNVARAIAGVEGTQARAEEVDYRAIWEADRAAFWQLIEQHLRNDKERKTIQARFIGGLPPREIAQIYGYYFNNDPAEVSKCLAGIFYRLRKDPRLREWFNNL